MQISKHAKNEGNEIATGFIYIINITKGENKKRFSEKKNSYTNVSLFLNSDHWKNRKQEQSVTA